MGVIVSFPLTVNFRLVDTSFLRTPRYNETSGNTIHVICELLHSTLLNYASEKFLYFALNTLLHFASMLLHFAG